LPFIRRTRDKSGHETTYVMHSYRPTHQEPNRTRVLYLFRSPAHLRIGREPLDGEVKEALEHTHPDMSFDWTSLMNDVALSRQESSDRTDRYDRGGRGERGDRRGRSERPQRDRRPPAPEAATTPPPIIEDESVLGRVVGASRASVLRQRYAELIQRIARRSRTPEDRDRLTERAQRQNPDEWPDEGAVRSNAQSVEAEWDAIAAELPSRRRGRRGGRRRSQAPMTAPGASHEPATAPETAGPSDEASGIMDEGDNGHEDGTPEDLSSHGAGASHHGSSGGPAGAQDGPADADLQVDDRPDHD
jgi:hypothetical protein